MPAFDHHFMPLNPPIEGKDYHGIESKGLINFQTNCGHALIIRFLCLDEQVRVIAVTIPEAVSGHPDQSKWMKQIMETSISALRLSVDTEALPIFTREGFINLMYQSDDPEPLYQMSIESRINSDYRLNIDHVVGVFGAISDRKLASIAALFAEGQVLTIPPHYRVLSFIRAIELLYPNERDRAAILDQYGRHFAGLGISEHPFRSALPQLRTRCAHGTSRGRSNPEPFVGIGYNEPQLMSLLTLLQSVVGNGLTAIHGLPVSGNIYQPEPTGGSSETSSA